MKRAQIFISYAQKDVRWREEFERMFAPACERGFISVWSDEHIAAGEDWRKNIQRALTTTQVALLLVTDHFLSTDFITQVELPEFLSAAKNGRVSIRWVPVSESLYKCSDLGDIQACCDPRKPVARLSIADRKAAIQKICAEIVEEFGATTKISPSRRESLRAQVQARLGDKYKIVDEISSGKFSIVYRAVQRRPKRTVAVKVLVASELDHWARGQFVKGVERSYELTSPAFITTIDHFMDQTPEFLISEFIEGEQLSSVLRNYPQGLPLAKVKSILRDLAKALEDAHEHGFWRGEMCPSDILIEASGSPRLSPFDFSNLLREEGQMRGTLLTDQESLAYMTPERYFGQPSTVFTDQFSLGIMATELLGGPRIPRVTRPSDLELKRSLFKDLEMGKGEWAKRSPEFTGVVCRMLRTDPEKRWPSMSEVRNVLRDVEVVESADELQRQVAKKSYYRFQARGVEGEREFFGKFYENLFSALPEVERHFRSIDMERQYSILNRAIYALLEFRPDSQVARKQLEDLALRHATLRLTRRHYEIFLDSLVKTIEEFGTNGPEELAAWRGALKPGIAFLGKCQEALGAGDLAPQSKQNI